MEIIRRIYLLINSKSLRGKLLSLATNYGKLIKHNITFNACQITNDKNRNTSGSSASILSSCMSFDVSHWNTTSWKERCVHIINLPDSTTITIFKSKLIKVLENTRVLLARQKNTSRLCSASPNL